MKQEYQVQLQWVGYPLHPETPLEGQSLEEMFAGRGLDIPAMLKKLAGVAAREGLPFGMRTMTYNSRRAQELAKFAEQQGRGEQYNEAVFRAYFANGRNIADIAVLGDVAEHAGLERGQAREMVEGGRFSAEVDADWQHSRGVGITAVPTFIAGGSGLVGAQPYGALARLAEAAGAQKRT